MSKHSMRFGVSASCEGVAQGLEALLAADDSCSRTSSARPALFSAIPIQARSFS